MRSEEKLAIAQAISETRGYSAWHDLTAEDVVEAAKDPESPIHDLFQWDDSSAAHEYRLGVARRFISSIRVKVEIADIEENAPAVRVSAFTSPVDQREYGGGYLSDIEVISDGSYRLRPGAMDRKARDALRDLGIFRSRHQAALMQVGALDLVERAIVLLSGEPEEDN